MSGNRTNATDSANRVTTSTVGRGTLREIDDDHLCQECKTGDAGFSRTHTSFEMWTPLGMTAVAVKQKDDKQKQGQQGQQGGGNGGGGGDADWNKNQPMGEAAEYIINYVNGSASHPVGFANDRRVRPYGLKQGEASFYSADGSGQSVYHRTRGDQADGLYVLTCDDQQGSQSLIERADGQQGGTRMVSVRHANKPKQRRKKSQQGQQGGGGPSAFADGGDSGNQGQGGGRLPDDSKSKYKHEGESINTETQYTAQRINFNEGAGDIGYYDREKDWMHHMPGDKKKSQRCDKDHTHIMSEKGQVIWVDSQTKNCYSSKPIIIKPDECKVD